MLIRRRMSSRWELYYWRNKGISLPHWHRMSMSLGLYFQNTLAFQIIGRGLLRESRDLVTYYLTSPQFCVFRQVMNRGQSQKLSQKIHFPTDMIRHFSLMLWVNMLHLNLMVRRYHMIQWDFRRAMRGLRRFCPTMRDTLGRLWPRETVKGISLRFLFRSSIGLIPKSSVVSKEQRNPSNRTIRRENIASWRDHVTLLVFGRKWRLLMNNYRGWLTIRST